MIDPICPDYANTPVSPQRPSFSYVPLDFSARPGVTIITPFYNTGAVFHDTARSILNQSFQQWEWLIINDGTTAPESLAILDQYRQRDPRIRVIDHEQNRGLSAARNTGFHAACTPYVVQIDSDDLLEPTAIEKWVWFLESYPEVAFAKGYSIGFGAQEYLWEKGFHNGSAFLEDNLVDATCVMRRDVHRAVHGNDESMREGLEDWDFWLRCADAGYWGGTIPEYLNWYRRRDSHDDRWANLHAERLKAFRMQLRERYARLWDGGFPQIQPQGTVAHAVVPDALPWENRLQRNKPRLLMVVPWLTLGGADKFNLDVVAQLTQRGWEVTIVTTLAGDNSWLPAFARYTPDIFLLPHFLRLTDQPRFLRYVIHSRQIQTVLCSNSELGYLLLPYLRVHHPEVTFIDFCHMEEEQWKNGGYPRMAVENQPLLDLSVVSSAHLQRWYVQHGADEQRIRVCYTNIDTTHWQPPTLEERAAVRQKLHIDAGMPVLLYAGRICQQKQPRVFAQTVWKLAQHSPSFLALVAGDGPDLAWLRSFVHQQHLDTHVRFLGALSNAQLRELLWAVDIFFLPSEWEGIALSLYEAMACGIPVVSADVGGQRELVTPACGMLLARSDEDNEATRYAAALATLLQEPQRRLDMGKAGRQRVTAHFRLEQMGENFLELLQEAERLRKTIPRPIPSLDLGRMCATRAVEYLRLAAVADGLWRERTQTPNGPLGFHAHLLDPHSDSWRTLAYFTLRRFFLPTYRVAHEKNSRWLVPVKNKVKQFLLREPRP